MEEYRLNTYFDKKREDRINEIDEQIKKLKEERQQIGRDYVDELHLPLHTLAYAYYNEVYKGEKIQNVRLVMISYWRMSDYFPLLQAKVYMVNDKGETGNEISFNHCNDITLEPLDCTLEEAKKVIKEVKKTVKKDKEKADKLWEEKRKMFNPDYFKF